MIDFKSSRKGCSPVGLGSGRNFVSRCSCGWETWMGLLPAAPGRVRPNTCPWLVWFFVIAGLLGRGNHFHLCLPKAIRTRWGSNAETHLLASSKGAKRYKEALEAAKLEVLTGRRAPSLCPTRGLRHRKSLLRYRLKA